MWIPGAIVDSGACPTSFFAAQLARVWAMLCKKHTGALAKPPTAVRPSRAGSQDLTLPRPAFDALRQHFYAYCAAGRFLAGVCEPSNHSR